MIRPAQLKFLSRARQALALSPAEFGEALRRCGGADRVEDLTAAGFARLADHLTIEGYTSRERPTISARTRTIIEELRERLGLSDHTYQADLRAYAGIADLRDLSGRGLIALLTRWEAHGLIAAKFVEWRREITPAQVRLVQLARSRVEMPDARYYRMIQDYGGVVSSKDLDRRGFDLVMAYLEAEGFDRAPLAREQPGFGRRPGFATPEQIELIRALWREWSGEDVEADLNAWLERYHRASSLRFLTTGAAAKAIAGLKAMKARKAAAARREAQHA